MGGEVSEFHIVEGDKDFTGASKAYEFPAILQSGKLDQWKAKITYHKAQIPEGVKAYELQEAQRLLGSKRCRNGVKTQKNIRKLTEKHTKTRTETNVHAKQYRETRNNQKRTDRHTDALTETNRNKHIDILEDLSNV